MIAPAPRWIRWLNLVFLALGAGALAWMASVVGVETLTGGIRAVGLGFVLSSLGHFVSIAVDAITLRACTNGGEFVAYRTYLRVSLAGHAINEATPLNKLGELTKLALLGEYVGGERATAALIVQNIAMFVVSCGLIGVGSLIAIAAVPLDPLTNKILAVAAFSFVLIGFAAVVFLYRGPGEIPFRVARRLGFSAARIDSWHRNWNRLETHWQSVAATRSRMIATWVSAIASRAGDTFEIVVILYLLDSPLVWSVAILSLGASQLVMWLSALVPLQTGTAEGGAYLLFRQIGLQPALGVTLELVRKLRRLVFIALGVTLLGWTTARSILGK